MKRAIFLNSVSALVNYWLLMADNRETEIDKRNFSWYNF